MLTQEEQYRAKRKRDKELRLAYRAVAGEIAKHVTSQHEAKDWPDFITVPQYSNVVPSEDGAFVEAIIYVTREQVENYLVSQARVAYFKALTDAKDACEQLLLERKTAGSQALYQAVWHLWNRTPAGAFEGSIQHGGD